MGGVAFQLSFLEARPSRCSRIATFPSLFATRVYSDPACRSCNGQWQHKRARCGRSGDLPAGRAIAVEIEGPYGAPSDVPRPGWSPSWALDRALWYGKWQAPTPPRLLVARTRRDHPTGSLFARGQIGQPVYAPARDYQALVERAGRGIHRRASFGWARTGGSRDHSRFSCGVPRHCDSTLEMIPKQSSRPALSRHHSYRSASMGSRRAALRAG